MDNLPFVWVVIFFLISAAVIWVSGIELAKTTDTLDTRYKLGEALGGLVLLGIVTTLPEIAIATSAAVSHNYDIVLGSLIGGVSIKALCIVILDFFSKGKKPLSYLAGSKIIFYESIFVLVMLGVVAIGAKLPEGGLNYNPISIALPFLWIIGILVVGKLRKRSDLYELEESVVEGRMHHERRKVHNHIFYRNKSNLYVIVVFLASALTTLMAGIIIERCSGPIIGRIGFSGGLFAATILSLISALPEISTGIQSLKINDNQLAVSDVLGGSALLPTVFIIAELASGRAILSMSQGSEMLLLLLGILMTAVYALGLFFKTKLRLFRVGIDSIFVVGLYVAGILIISRMG